jgi:hypothetical protein
MVVDSEGKDPCQALRIPQTLRQRLRFLRQGQHIRKPTELQDGRQQFTAQIDVLLEPFVVFGEMLERRQRPLKAGHRVLIGRAR